MTDEKNEMHEDTGGESQLERDFFEQKTQGANPDAGVEGASGADVPADTEMAASFRPKWQRSPIMAVFFIPLGLFLIYLLWPDLSFGVRGLFQRSPQDVGEISEALAAGKLQPNTWVHGRGMVSIQSQLPVPHTKSRGRVDGYYVYYILLNTHNRVLVKRFSREGLITERLPTEFTGRLMRISDVEEGVRLRAYYRNNVQDPPADILFREFQEESAETADAPGAPAAVLNAIEELAKPSPQLVADTGEKFMLRPDMKADVKAYFLPDMVVSFNREHAVTTRMRLVAGASRPGPCPPAAGGDVILRRDPETLILPDESEIRGTDFQPPEGFTPPPGGGCPACPKTDAPMKQPPVEVRIPANSAVVDATTRKPVEFAADGTFVLPGASCGETPREVTLEITHRPFEKLEDCYRWLIARGYPFALPGQVPEAPGGDWDIVARIPENDVKQLREKYQMRRDCSEKEAGRAADCVIVQPALRLAPRWKFLFDVPVSEMRIQGQEFVVTRARTDFPPQYEEAMEPVDLGGGEKKVARILKPRPAETSYRLALNMISKLQFHSPTVIQKDAFIILEDVSPSDFQILWKIPVVLILLAIVLLNVRTLVRRFRGV